MKIIHKSGRNLTMTMSHGEAVAMANILDSWRDCIGQFGAVTLAEENRVTSVMRSELHAHLAEVGPKEIVISGANKLDFRRNAIQKYKCSWFKILRICRYFGRCFWCSLRLYKFDDQKSTEILGDRIGRIMSPPKEATGSPLLICKCCFDTSELFNKFVEKAFETNVWRKIKK